MSLTKPIQAYGELVAELVLRPGTAGDLCDCGYPLISAGRVKQATDMEAVGQLAARLANVPPSSIAQLNFHDGSRLAATIAAMQQTSTQLSEAAQKLTFRTGNMEDLVVAGHPLITGDRGWSYVDATAACNVMAILADVPIETVRALSFTDFSLLLAKVMGFIRGDAASGEASPEAGSGDSPAGEGQAPPPAPPSAQLAAIGQAKAA